MKGMYSEAIIVATLLTLILAFVGFLIWTVTGPKVVALITLAIFWRVVFVWVQDTDT